MSGNSHMYQIRHVYHICKVYKVYHTLLHMSRKSYIYIEARQKFDTKKFKKRGLFDSEFSPIWVDFLGLFRWDFLGQKRTFFGQKTSFFLIPFLHYSNKQAGESILLGKKFPCNLWRKWLKIHFFYWFWDFLHIDYSVKFEVGEILESKSPLFFLNFFVPNFWRESYIYTYI